MGTIELDHRTVETSSVDKILFPDDGITKGALIDYYLRIADTMVPHLKDRPLTLRRFPNGIGQEGFYQQEMPDYFPDWIERVEVEKKDGKIVHALCNDAATLVYLANQNTITPHVWLSRIDKLNEPDQIVFDLDPPRGNFNQVRKAARYVREILEDRGMTAFVMTTGSSGLHVRAPIRRGHAFDLVRSYARGLAAELAERYPDELTTEQRKNKRRGRIYLDIMRNAYGQTAVPPYAVRARAGASIATPVDWEELSEVNPDSYHVRNIFRRIGQKEDPWKDMMEKAREISMEEGARKGS